MAKQLFGTDGIRGVPENFRWTTARYFAWDARWENFCGLRKLLRQRGADWNGHARIGRAYRRRNCGGAGGSGSRGVGGSDYNAGRGVPGAAREIFGGNRDFRFAQSLSTTME